MAASITITVNGHTERIQAVRLPEYLSAKSTRPEMLIVEYNARIIPRKAWPSVVLKEGDCLEILRFVGGG